MELSEEKTLPVPRDAVWAALNSLDVLRDCIPGCETITLVGDEKYEIVLLAAVGPVKARFKGQMAIVDSSAPTGYSLQFEGSGGAAGFARGTATVTLAEAGPEQTVLNYTASATVGGKIAQIGSRLVDSASRMMADRFFTAFTAHPALNAREQA